MPARIEEVKHAEEEGVVFRMLTNPVEVLGDESHEDGWHGEGYSGGLGFGWADGRAAAGGTLVADDRLVLAGPAAARAADSWLITDSNIVNDGDFLWLSFVCGEVFPYGDAVTAAPAANAHASFPSPIRSPLTRPSLDPTNTSSP